MSIMAEVLQLLHFGSSVGFRSHAARNSVSKESRVGSSSVSPSVASAASPRPARVMIVNAVFMASSRTSTGCAWVGTHSVRHSQSAHKCAVTTLLRCSLRGRLARSWHILTVSERIKGVVVAMESRRKAGCRNCRRGSHLSTSTSSRPCPNKRIKCSWKFPPFGLLVCCYSQSIGSGEFSTRGVSQGERGQYYERGERGCVGTLWVLVAPGQCCRSFCRTTSAVLVMMALAPESKVAGSEMRMKSIPLTLNWTMGPYLRYHFRNTAGWLSKLAANSICSAGVGEGNGLSARGTAAAASAAWRMKRCHEVCVTSHAMSMLGTGACATWRWLVYVQRMLLASVLGCLWPSLGRCCCCCCWFVSMSPQTRQSPVLHQGRTCLPLPAAVRLWSHRLHELQHQRLQGPQCRMTRAVREGGREGGLLSTSTPKVTRAVYTWS